MELQEFIKDFIRNGGHCPFLSFMSDVRSACDYYGERMCERCDEHVCPILRSVEVQEVKNGQEPA